MNVIGERGLNHAVTWIFLAEAIHEYQNLLSTHLCIVVDKVFER